MRERLFARSKSLTPNVVVLVEVEVGNVVDNVDDDVVGKEVAQVGNDCALVLLLDPANVQRDAANPTMK